MRSSSIAASLFIAGALATPFSKRQNVVYDTDVVVETVYVYPGQPTPTPQAPAPAPAAPKPVVKAPAPVPAPAPAPVAAVATGGGYRGPDSYSQTAVDAHNEARSQHIDTPLMDWDDALYQSAKMVADTCVFEHNMNVLGGGYGQNIACGVAPENIHHVVYDMFYANEINAFSSMYNWADPDMTNFLSWGHATQVLWKTSTKVACATSYCPNGVAGGGGSEPYFTACHYLTPGNVAGQYGQNVGLPRIGA